eukprot:scaffold114769_cov52-Phaeocystis_antarctica.AAC.3
MMVIATVEAVGIAEEHGDYDPIRDVAVHGDQVIVLTTDNHPKGSGLRLLDLNGRFLRTIAAGQFHYPQAVAASHGRAFVVDDDEFDDEVDDVDDESGKVLHVIDIQSGDIFQRVRFDLVGLVSAILVDGNEIYISSVHGANAVLVLQFAGSEA